MGTHWEQNIKNNPNTLLAPKRGEKNGPSGACWGGGA